MTVLLAEIASAITIVMALIGFILTFFKIIRRFERLEEANKNRKEESVVLLHSVWATLDGLTQLGCNGDVSKAKQAMQDYIIKRGD